MDARRDGTCTAADFGDGGPSSLTTGERRISTSEPNLRLETSAGAKREENWLRGVRPFVPLCLLCAILYSPGLASIPPVDRDEARFAQATRQMLETGDLVRIRFQDEERNKKPVGIHWLQAASVGLFGTPHSTKIWPYRLPSALAATVAVLLAGSFGAGLLGSRQGGFIAAVLLASAIGLVVEAHLAKTDAVLLSTVVAGQAALGLAYVGVRACRPPPWRIALVFWLAEAAGILLKGPVAPALAMFTAATLSIADRDILWLKALRPALGLVGVALITAPWFVAIEDATAGRFLADSLGHDFVAKLIGARESHGAPPGSYLAASLASFWPGSLFLVPALVWGWRRRRDPAPRFLLAWLCPAWAFFELMPTKLPHYVLPLYPALALLVGGALAKGSAVCHAGLLRLVDAGVTALWGAVTISLAVALAVLPICLGPGISVGAGIAAGAVLALGLLLFRHRREPLRVAGFVSTLAAVFVLSAASIVPALDALWLSRSAARLLARYPLQLGKAVLSIGYHEPSLVLLTRYDHPAGDCRAWRYATLGRWYGSRARPRRCGLPRIPGGTRVERPSDRSGARARLCVGRGQRSAHPL